MIIAHGKRITGDVFPSSQHYFTSNISLTNFLGQENETKYLLLYAISYDINNNVDPERYSFGILSLTKLASSVKYDNHILKYGNNYNIQFIVSGNIISSIFYQFWTYGYRKGYFYIKRLN